jgi:hypothetical protein
MLAEWFVIGLHNAQELRPYLSREHTGYSHRGMEGYKQKNRQQREATVKKINNNKIGNVCIT